MRWMFACAAVLAAGCFPIQQQDPWGQRGVVMGTEARREQDRAKAMWEGRGNPWADLKSPSGVIGGDSSFRGGSAARAPSRWSPPPARETDTEVAREVQVLAARVDRLERLLTSGSAPKAAAPVAPVAKPALTIYKVHPDGRTAWVTAGSSSGVTQGQTFHVTRGGAAVAQVQVARVWPNVAELSVLVANGKLQRGDVVTPK